ncbi:MAG: FYDLN acid domain-containing protein [Rhodoplanes sp.]
MAKPELGTKRCASCSAKFYDLIPTRRLGDSRGFPNQPRNDSRWSNGGSFAMGQAIAVRTDYSSGEVWRLAQRAKNAGQARRLLAIAAVLDGCSRESLSDGPRETWILGLVSDGAVAMSLLRDETKPDEVGGARRAAL